MDRANDRLVRGVDDLESFAIDTLDPLIVDEEAGGLLILTRMGCLELD